jgi:hypothetical protein
VIQLTQGMLHGLVAIGHQEENRHGVGGCPEDAYRTDGKSQDNSKAVVCSRGGCDLVAEVFMNRN